MEGMPAVPKFLIGWAALVLTVVMGGAPAAGALAGLWEFDDPENPGRATFGDDLVIVGTAPAYAASAADGRSTPVTLQGVITTTAGPPHHLRASHHIGANGAPGAARVNQYTLVFDVKRPAGNGWRAFYQTNLANTSDAQYFVQISNATLGRTAITYSSGAMTANRWHRLVIAVDLEAGRYETYLDGELFHTHNAPAADGEFALDPAGVLFFADEDNENQPLTLGLVAIYSTPLEAAAIAALGIAGTPVAYDHDNQPPVLTSALAGPANTTTGMDTSYTFTATDPENAAVHVQVDWGDGTFSAWSEATPSGTPVSLGHAWNAPGAYTLKARARDAGFAVSEWSDVQTVAVTGPIRLTVVTPPYLQNASPTGMVVMAEIKEEAPLVLRYGPTTAYGGEMAFTSESHSGGARFYRARVAGLAPATTYHYQLATADGEPVTDDATFRTAPEAWEDVSFSLWADSQGTNHGAWSADPLEPTVSMMKHMVASGVDFGVTAGDLAESGGSYQDTRDYYLDRVARHLGTKVPWFNAWGNHDSGSPNAPLRRASDMPSGAREGFSSGHGSFDFLWAGIYFVCLDYFYQEEITNGWLAARLASPAAQAARFRIVVNHVPPYCERWIDGDATLRATLVPLLEAHHVDLVVSGHTHEYERGFRNGVHYLITGGGSWLDHTEPIVRDWPHMTVGGAQDVAGAWARESSRGVLGAPRPIVGGLFNEYVLATARGRHLRLETHAFHADGSFLGVLDAFDIGTPPATDSDGDGLPDEWETAHGLDPHSATGVDGAEGDPDGDGQSNLSEYLAGTDARDAASVLALVAFEPTGATARLTWSSLPGHRYRLAVSSDLQTWTPLTDETNQPRLWPASDGTTTTAEVPLPAPGFWRIEVAREE